MTPEPDVYCIEDGCHRLATHERLAGFTRCGDEIVELVCCQHHVPLPIAGLPDPSIESFHGLIDPNRRPWWQRLMGGRK